MTLYLYHHPFSSYCQKALVALYEKAVPFHPYRIDLQDPRSRAELATIWPYAKFPVLHDSETAMTLPEASLIVEHVDGIGRQGPKLLPADPVHLRTVRLWDRVIDNYLLDPIAKVVTDRLRPEGGRDPIGVGEARATIATTLDLLEGSIGGALCLGGNEFSLADCGAGPALFYAARLVPFEASHPRVFAYLKRLLERPSFARCVEEARPFRSLFPAAEGDAGWPDAGARMTF